MRGTHPVVIDLQAAQSPRHWERGIARYCVDLVRAVAEHHSDLVHEIVVDPDLPPVEGLGDIGVPVVTVPTWSPGGIFHILSPFELDLPVRRLWPRQASRLGMRMAVTVYDLIPDIFPDIYLQDPGSRRRYRARRELVRAADAVMAISSSAAHDTAHRLGLPPERVTVVGAAPAPTFQPPDNRSSAAREAMARVAGLEAPYVVYTGGPEPRKNMERLIEAWSRLLEPVRSAWQLAIVCKLDPLQDNHYRTLAARAGVADRVLLTGYVPDETLRLLYQGTDLVVFPSMYEGYGLPVAEGLACGAPAIASATSSLTDLVPPEATFDPYDTAAVTAAIAAALTDDRHRGMLLEWARRPPDRWADVAHRTAAVYRSLTPRPRPSGRGRRPRVALVSPMPPAAGELVADSVRLVVAAGSAMDVDVCVDGSVEVPGAGSAGGEPVGAASRSPLLRRPETGPWVEHAAAVLRPGTLQVMDAVLPGYDVVLLRLASGPSHQIARRIARRRFVDGPVLLVEDPTDVDLPDLAPAASRILLHTDAAAAAARRRIPDRFAGLVGVWPDVYPPVTERVPSGVQPGLICCFGAVEEQRPVRLVEAFSILARRGGRADQDRGARRASRRGLPGRAHRSRRPCHDRSVVPPGRARRAAGPRGPHHRRHRRLPGSRDPDGDPRPGPDRGGRRGRGAPGRRSGRGAGRHHRRRRRPTRPPGRAHRHRARLCRHPRHRARRQLPGRPRGRTAAHRRRLVSSSLVSSSLVSSRLVGSASCA